MHMRKVGRPKSEDPKDERITIRLREEDFKRLQEYADRLGVSKSEVLAQGLSMLLDQDRRDEK